MSDKIKYISTAKGIGIISVILGHLRIDGLDMIMFSFHMPLFFIISGLFFNPDRPLIPRLKSLLKPYLFTGISLVAIEFALSVYYYMTFKDFGRFGALKDWLIALVYGSGSQKVIGSYDIPVIGAIWFLLALGWAHTFLWLLAKARFPKLGELVAALVLLILGLFSARYVWLPFSIQPGLTATIFLYIGKEMKQVEPWKDSRFVTIGAALWIVSIVYTFLTGNILKMVSCKWHLVPLDILGPTGASILIIAFSQKIEHSPGKLSQFISLFGEMSLIVLCFHLIELIEIDFRVCNLCTSYGLSEASILYVRIAYKLVWAWCWIKIFKMSPLLQSLMTIRKQEHRISCQLGKN